LIKLFNFNSLNLNFACINFNHFYNFNNKYLLQIFILFFYFLESFNDLKKLLLCLFMNENLILIMSNILFEYF